MADAIMNITFNKLFTDNCKRLFVKPNDDVGKMVHAAVGIGSEAGELLDAIKKHWIYGKQLDAENVLEECGDVLFYTACLLDLIGYDLDQAMAYNMDKLKARYPNGYSDTAAIERKDKV